jgi:hypothetical protein
MNTKTKKQRKSSGRQRLTPTTPRPSIETLRQWMFHEGGCEAIDGCWVEPDGHCPHGQPSWLLYLGMI